MEASAGLKSLDRRASGFVCEQIVALAIGFEIPNPLLQGQVNHCRQNKLASCLLPPDRIGAPDFASMACFF
jgi:hypothetical protein